MNKGDVFMDHSILSILLLCYYCEVAQVGHV